MVQPTIGPYSVAAVVVIGAGAGAAAAVVVFSHPHPHASTFVRYTRTHMHTCALRYAAAFSIRLLPPHYRNTFVRRSRLVAYGRTRWIGLDWIICC